MKKSTKIIELMLQAALIGVGGYYLFMFVCPVFHMISNIGNILGAAMSLCAILVGIFMNKLIEFSKKHYKTKKGKILLNTFFTVFAAGLICFSLVLGSVVASAKTTADNQQTVIILGCAVRGETPSFTLRSRINAACDYLMENPQSVAILSGGQGNNEDISEAQCMYNILTENGISPDRLYLEDKSTNTGENIAFSKNIIDEYNLSTEVAVVSSDYHLKRAKMICAKNGLENAHTITAPSTYFDKPTFYLREVLGVVKEFIF
ncbi:MAG: YdcF family protein [Eubacterium sp.]|nr:YdcF family protein [Eubacterium sp.]